MLNEAIDEVFDQRIGDVSGRGRLGRRHARDLGHAAALRQRTARPIRHGAARRASRARFDFLRLRADVAEVREDLAEWWQVQAADDARREDLVAQVREEQRQKQKAAQPAARRRAPARRKEACRRPRPWTPSSAKAMRRREAPSPPPGKPAGGADMAPPPAAAPSDGGRTGLHRPGANLGDRGEALLQALHRMAALPQTRLCAVSSLYRQRARWRPRGRHYLNAVGGPGEPTWRPKPCWQACRR